MVVSKFLYFLIYESKHGLSSLDVCSLQHRLSWRARGYKRPLRPHNSSWPPDPCRMSAIESLERKPAALCSQPKSWPEAVAAGLDLAKRSPTALPILLVPAAPLEIALPGRGL